VEVSGDSSRSSPHRVNWTIDARRAEVPCANARVRFQETTPTKPRSSIPIGSQDCHPASRMNVGARRCTLYLWQLPPKPWMQSHSR
jgi:hypothetical protein